jgi:hypothetical protein
VYTNTKHGYNAKNQRDKIKYDTKKNPGGWEKTSINACVKKDRIYVGNGGREHNTKIKFISFSQPTITTTTQSHRV